MAASVTSQARLINAHPLAISNHSCVALARQPFIVSPVAKRSASAVTCAQLHAPPQVPSRHRRIGGAALKSFSLSELVCDS